MKNYFISGDKSDCFGCEACVQICPEKAVIMKSDEEGFRYPVINKELCVNCGVCEKVCGKQRIVEENIEKKYVFGGHIRDSEVLAESTSGGAFSAIVNSWCKKDYVIFGAETEGLKVKHSYITDKNEIKKFRKSKYSQSIIGTAYTDAKNFLKEGKKVLFSGTPCQISALKSFLGKEYDNLLTIEVICEGVPSPIFIEKYVEFLKKKTGSDVLSVDYRFKKIRKWDFQVMKVDFADGKTRMKDRWFNDFWVIWLNHLMSRPSCYKCPFTTANRVADISLGDLWGVHLYCPELYNRDKGASLVVCNTLKGKEAVKEAENIMDGHELDFETALKYQSPMRKSISFNPDRDNFMKDLVSDMDYIDLCKKWGKHPSIKLLWQKYIWGNRQKMFVWRVRNYIAKKGE
ncbi:MAG: Coenzyme F420 hydrogenase/dehydrogenase, beta subunit C-terminal domain [Clostridia bacterium]|nr:Coenzyme F420 hydrogenase/dehydrogenase, beta subunit C-terminal domain [Clostridia bacterium]